MAAWAWPPVSWVALFLFAAIGGGLLVGATVAAPCSVRWPATRWAGMSRKDLKELGELLDEGQAGLVVVGVADLGCKSRDAMEQAEKVERRNLEADTAM